MYFQLTTSFLLGAFLIPPVPQATMAPGTGSKARAGATLICADAVADQSGGGCMQASSTATPGLLFPYPGSGNTFGTQAFVTGGAYNNASGFRSFVGAGRHNSASGNYATIGGGVANTAGFSGTVGGGTSNSASGGSATVGGGTGNTASGGSATAGGGSSNAASGVNATVGGGYANTASGNFSAVPGGADNTALGSYSFAAGRRAKANHAGAFVWGDSFDGDKTSSAVDQFNVYASGGTRIFSNTAATAGVLLAAGGSSWTMVSDRGAKENFEDVNGREILERVAALPISTWNYKEQDDSVRHMGPMAQDFWAAFGLGLGDTTIDTLDPSGVALAAIQGLRQEKDAEIAELRKANEQLRAELVALRTQLAPALR